MIKEFKEFIKRGNVMDLAVGVIVGGAFSSIVTSLVNNLLTPILGIFLGGIDFSGLSLQIKDATINYGLFIQSIIDFLIIAFCIFLLIKIINRIMTVGKKDIKEDLPKLPPKKAQENYQKERLQKRNYQKIAFFFYKAIYVKIKLRWFYGI